jgi:hypothetical protein
LNGRWPGASLVIIRGHKHLHQCAYIGDDSSEELEEMEGNFEESVQWPITSLHEPNRIDRHSSSNGENSNELNQPTRMRRVRPGVTFHSNNRPIGSREKLEQRDDADSDDVDNIIIQLIRNVAWAKSRIKAKNGVTSSPSKSYPREYTVSTESPRSNITKNSAEDSSAQTSSEVFEDVLRRLQRLGNRGKNVLRRLNKQMGDVIPNKDDGFNTLRNIIREMIKEQDVGSNNRSEGKLDRSRRGITLAPPSLRAYLNMHAEDEDAANEEVSKRLC